MNDHFGQQAAQYAQYRPDYPPALYAWLLAQVSGRDVAWDAGTGNGQVALPLAQHFTQVYATDSSLRQLAQAAPHAHICYLHCPAEATPLPAQCAQLITVGQAYHWFDAPRFCAEARRVGVPGALLAVWTYSLLQLEDAALDTIVRHFYTHTLGPYWDAARRWVDAGYRDMYFDVAHELEPPTLYITVHWTLAHLAGYLRTWSAVQAYMRAHAHDPVADVVAAMAPLWGTRPARSIRFHLHLRAGRI